MTGLPKRQVRSARRAARRAIAAGRDAAADDRALATRVLALLAELGVDRPGTTVTLYESWAGEPPTPATVAALQARGIRVLVPITTPDLDLDWADAADPHRMPLGPLAIDRADVVLAPGLSVDRAGTRIGQGGGCYDKALPRRRPGAPVWVVLHPGELLEGPDDALPREPHDHPVDGVVTAEGHTALR